MMPAPKCSLCDDVGFVYLKGGGGVVRKCDCKIPKPAPLTPKPLKLKAPKRIAPESVESLAIEKANDATREEKRQTQVMRLCRELRAAEGDDPSTGEILRFGLAKGEQLHDVNSVRPMMTWLRDKGLVDEMPSRPCKTTGRTVKTWRVK